MNRNPEPSGVPPVPASAALDLYNVQVSRLSALIGATGLDVRALPLEQMEAMHATVAAVQGSAGTPARDRVYATSLEMQRELLDWARHTARTSARMLELGTEFLEAIAAVAEEGPSS